MAIPEFLEIESLYQEFHVVPVCQEIFADAATPVNLLRRLGEVDRNYFLLESMEEGRSFGRYTFLGVDPLLKAVCQEGTVCLEGKGIKKAVPGEPAEVLRELLKDYTSPRIEGLPPFTGGLVGYFSYGMLRCAEPLLELQESGYPEFELMLFDKVIAFDHFRQKICVIVNMRVEDGIQGYNKALLEIDKMIGLVYDRRPLPDLSAPLEVEFHADMNRDEFMAAVERVKAYIREGDIFQGVISRKFQADYQGSLVNAYRILRTLNPSPYMYFLRCGETEIAGSSPETLVKVFDRKITTFPVAGTRRRGSDPGEDKRLEEELLKDEKELAEHNMLVDLARNDVGKISQYGSVKVEKYMEIHRFSKVMHIASTVTGVLQEGVDGLDAVLALLPAGTLSGAPKFRACQIIDELEQGGRGIYSGAVGYLDFAGNLDVCIAIRTAVKRDGVVTVQAGSGIVADSDPAAECDESENKAAAVMEAVIRAAEVNGL